MKKSNFFRRGLCLLLAFVLVAGYLTPAGAVESDAGLTFGIEQIGNDAVSAELPLAKVENTAEAEKDMNEMVRVSIQLEQASTLDAGFRVKGAKSLLAQGTEQGHGVRGSPSPARVTKFLESHILISPGGVLNSWSDSS